MRLSRYLFKIFHRRPSICLLILTAGICLAAAAWLASDADEKRRRDESGEMQ